MRLLPEDLKIEVDPRQKYQHGGQHVGKPDVGIMITHMPSGYGVMYGDEKSQHRNKAKALEALRIVLEKLGIVEPETEDVKNLP